VSVSAPAPPATSERPTKPGARWTTWAGLAAFVAITLWSALEPLGGIGFSLTALFTEQAIRGRQLIMRFFTPEWSFLPGVWPRFLETLYIAVIAAPIGCALALPVALFCSRVTNRNRALYQAWRTFLSVVRSLPDVAWALLFVAAVGTGALPGVLALIMFNMGIVAKLTSESIDSVDLGPLEAADATGAGRIQRAWTAVVPQVLPTYLSYSLYVFELNLRASIVLGLVGAGGIGTVIRVTFARFEFERLGAVIAAVFVIVVVLDRISVNMRRRLV
jgi:phosphonate transport system permease protein